MFVAKFDKFLVEQDFILVRILDRPDVLAAVKTELGTFAHQVLKVVNSVLNTTRSPTAVLPADLSIERAYFKDLAVKARVLAEKYKR